MERKLVMVLLTATLVGSMMTGCGSKETTETAAEETQTEEATETDAEETEDAEAEEETAEAEDENAVEIDESTLMDSEIPEDPDETIAILLAIKDYDLRFDYFNKANKNNSTKSVTSLPKKNKPQSSFTKYTSNININKRKLSSLMKN